MPDVNYKIKIIQSKSRNDLSFDAIDCEQRLSAQKASNICSTFGIFDFMFNF